jgi:hypothetical protein
VDTRGHLCIEAPRITAPGPCCARADLGATEPDHPAAAPFEAVIREPPGGVVPPLAGAARRRGIGRPSLLRAKRIAEPESFDIAERSLMAAGLHGLSKTASDARWLGVRRSSGEACLSWESVHRAGAENLDHVNRFTLDF